MHANGHRALLLFVPQYASPNWPNLEYLHTEYLEISRSMAEQGYVIDPASGCRDFLAAELNDRIADFVRGAARGEWLVVYLSGHGFQYNGTHWFAAHDSEPDPERRRGLKSTNVSLDEDWPKEVEESRCAETLFVIDACRDRLVADTGDVLSRPNTTPPASGRLSYLLACAPEERAAYVSEGATGFSLFTRALRDVLADAQAPLGADRLRALIDQGMQELRRRHPGSDQEARLSSEGGRQRFAFLPAPVPVLPYGHGVWRRAEGSVAQLREETEYVAQGLARRLEDDRKPLADDPWVDWESGRRAAARLEQLVDAMPDARFTPRETAVLVMAPALYHGFRLSRAVDAVGLTKPSRAHSKVKAAWERYPRLDQQTTLRNDPRRSDRDRYIAQAWVVHRSEVRMASARDFGVKLRDYIETVAGTEQLSEILHIDLVAWLFRAMQEGAGVLAEPPVARDGADFVVRYELIGHLLAAAQIMALDLAELPPVLVENSGGRDRVGLAQVRRDVNAAEWEITDRTVRLRAACSHQAVMVALQERVGFLDGLIGARTSVPEELAALPSRASADEVTPADVDGRKRFLPVVTRFGLDGPRVRELLIGEQLYTDRNLAVRELYQNAMDACEVRLARETLLARSHQHRPEWRGRIRISQGMEGPRRFLQCVDNGSGMGREELVHAFAQGGARLSHLSPFQEEKRLWEWEKIPFRENSRFGIGVLSYFMLADEIEVETRKFLKDGSPAVPLSVTIAGPDHLFQVREHSEESDFLGEVCGTRVRWYLRSDVPADFSCVRALRAVLGVARFDTEAGEEAWEWRPQEQWRKGEYRSRPDSVGGLSINATGQVVADTHGDVYWCEHGGALLVDGIATRANWYPPGAESGRDMRPAGEMRVVGAVVNLQGSLGTTLNARGSVPQLSVDRSQILHDVFEPLQKRLRKAAPSLAASELLTEAWLAHVADTEPRVADQVVQGLVECGARLVHEDGSASDIVRTGFLSADVDLRCNWTRYRSPKSRSRRHDAYWRVARLPGHLALWRYLAYFPTDVERALGDCCPSDLPSATLRWARPSDAWLLGDDEGRAVWDGEPQLGDVVHYARTLNLSLSQTLTRLGELGRPVLVPGRLDGEALPGEETLLLLSRDNDGMRPWLPPGQKVSPIAMLTTCENTKLTTHEAFRLLESCGYDTSPYAALRDPGSPAASRARILFSARLDGLAPWASEPIGAKHIVDAARQLNTTPRAVREELRALGVDVIRQAELGGPYRSLHLALNRINGDEQRTSPVTSAHVLNSAYLTGETVENTALALEAIGYTVSEHSSSAGSAPEHAHLLGIPLDDGLSIDLDEPASLMAVHRLARRSGESLARTGELLRSLGVDVPFDELPLDLTPDEVQLFTACAASPGGQEDGLNPVLDVPLAHLVYKASALDLPLLRVAERMKELGALVGPMPEPLPPVPASQVERAALGAWIPYPGRPNRGVPWGHVVCTAQWNGWTSQEAAVRLRQWGLPVVDPSGSDWPEPEAHDLTLLSRNADARTPWLDLARPVSTRHVVRAARVTGMSIVEARERLLALGARISRPERTTGEVRFRELAGDDATLLTQAAWGAKYLTDSAELPAAWVLIRAMSTDLPALEVAERLRAAGLRLQDYPYPDAPMTAKDLVILKENAYTSNDWMPLETSVGLEHLLVCAHRLHTTVEDMADRMRRFGYAVPPVTDMVADAWAKVPRTAEASDGCLPAW
ncbi:caspase family protein [Streptomyces sp. HB132]|uniref:wHTH domain-containing protein n=1 Tax=Streptomyces sp. HB132 TaxID=767388 RepID=UPI001961C508|nr:caspase family protein [Streptomyces sp. HB132]MBM7437132.1 hypothetical protein [Streptomyces sp. HB132]